MVMLGHLFRLSHEIKRQPRIPQGLRIYVVGDIHGRADLLHQLKTLIEIDLQAYPIREARAVFLGDYIDRGPDSKGVIEILSSQSFPTPIIGLRGNHEVMLLAYLNRREPGHFWMRNGGLETLCSYGVDVGKVRLGRGLDEAAVQLQAKLPISHRTFLENLQLSFTAGDYFFCHAGIRPGIPSEQQREEDLLWIRDEFLKSKRQHGKVVVHGHTPALEPEVLPNRINVDTGAYISGRLTCLVLQGEDKRFIVAEDARARAASFGRPR